MIALVSSLGLVSCKKKDSGSNPPPTQTKVTDNPQDIIDARSQGLANVSFRPTQGGEKLAPDSTIINAYIGSTLEMLVVIDAPNGEPYSLSNRNLIQGASLDRGTQSGHYNFRYQVPNSREDINFNFTLINDGTGEEQFFPVTLRPTNQNSNGGFGNQQNPGQDPFYQPGGAPLPGQQDPFGGFGQNPNGQIPNGQIPNYGQSPYGYNPNFGNYQPQGGILDPVLQMLSSPLQFMGNLVGGGLNTAVGLGQWVFGTLANTVGGGLNWIFNLFTP